MPQTNPHTIQEAKQFLNAKDEAPQKIDRQRNARPKPRTSPSPSPKTLTLTQAAAAARDPRANAKPKVDLFS
eukprot:scaffold57360_cov55-Phaeocystis_antarctica.AAC.2